MKAKDERLRVCDFCLRSECEVSPIRKMNDDEGLQICIDCDVIHTTTSAELKRETNPLYQEIDRLKETIEHLVYLCLTHGIISRGKACEYLQIDRAELDEWIEERHETQKGEAQTT